MKKYVDGNLCWTQDEDSFARRPRINPIALVEYVLSYCLLLKDLYKLTCPVRAISVPLLVGVKDTILPAGAPGTAAYETPLTATHPPDEGHLEGKPIIANYRGRERADITPRRLAFLLLQQIYEFYGHDRRDIPYSQDGSIIYNLTDEEQFAERSDTVRSYISEHIDTVVREMNDTALRAQCFQTKSNHHFLVSRNFLEDNNPDTIRKKLHAWNAAAVIAKIPVYARVRITNDGVSIDA